MRKHLPFFLLPILISFLLSLVHDFVVTSEFYMLLPQAKFQVEYNIDHELLFSENLDKRLHLICLSSCNYDQIMVPKTVKYILRSKKKRIFFSTQIQKVCVYNRQ